MTVPLTEQYYYYAAIYERQDCKNVYFVMQYTLFAKSFLFHYQNITVTR